jgi:hypothetical protein
MKTITKTYNVYQFSELSEEAKENAINKLADINVGHDYWYESTLDDAAEVKLKITEFDLDRNRHCKGEFMESAPETAELILQNHGKDCETYKTAKHFLNALDELTGQKENIEDVDEDEIEDLEDEFLQSILEDYSIILQKECEYLQSEEAIIETIQANEYEFLEDGSLA